MSRDGKCPTRPPSSSATPGERRPRATAPGCRKPAALPTTGSRWSNSAGTWPEQFGAFEDGGDPSFVFLVSCQSAGLVLTEFGFLRNGHVIHRGRGTLARPVDTDERSNPLSGGPSNTTNRTLAA